MGGAIMNLYVLIAVAATIGFQHRAEAQTPAAIRDSAGVRIVTATGDGGLPVLRTRPGPSWEVGRADGPPDQQLFNVVDGFVRIDGTVILANSGTHEVRAYDESGRLRWSVGRRGQGPGEYLRIRSARPFAGGDSIFVYDSELRRVTILVSATGLVARTYDPGERGGVTLPRFLGVFDDGTSVFYADRVYGDRSETGIDRQRVTIHILSPDGTHRAVAGEYASMEGFVHREAEQTFVADRLFGRNAVADARGSQLVIGTTDSYEVGLYDSGGALRQFVRVKQAPTTVTQVDVETAVDSIVSGFVDENLQRAMRRVYAEMPIPETYPAYRMVRLDQSDNVWIEGYPRPGADRSAWRVFAPDGSPLARVELPAGAKPLDVGLQAVLVVVRDELGVEVARTLELEVP